MYRHPCPNTFENSVFFIIWADYIMWIYNSVLSTFHVFIWHYSCAQNQAHKNGFPSLTWKNSSGLPIALMDLDELEHRPWAKPYRSTSVTRAKTLYEHFLRRVEAADAAGTEWKVQQSNKVLTLQSPNTFGLWASTIWSMGIFHLKQTNRTDNLLTRLHLCRLSVYWGLTLRQRTLTCTQHRVSLGVLLFLDASEILWLIANESKHQRARVKLLSVWATANAADWCSRGRAWRWQQVKLGFHVIYLLYANNYNTYKWALSL